MSIWASLPGQGDAITTSDYDNHDNYSGDVIGTTFVDIATARSFHRRVRLIVDDAEVVISAADARRIAAHLVAAANAADPLD